MDTIKICPTCAGPIPADAPGGVCPKCLLNAGFESNSGAEANPTAGFVPPDPSELARHFPQLEIMEVLGMGGMGVVYKVRQVALDRIVALKILPPDSRRDPAFAERFAREARALAKLNHPNIVGIYDFGQAGDYYYFLMEFIDGVNLRQMFSAQRLSPHEALSIVPQVCDALQYAHDQGVVHRDIKPENILVDRRGRVRIADFGLARLLGAVTEARLTLSQHVMGTPHYMAPEQFEKPLTVDHRADIYSLGVVIYEMLTGDLPIGRFALPSQKVQVNVRLDDIVLKTLEREPERRYQHASDVKSEMETLEGVPLSKLPPGLRNVFGTEYRSPRTLFGLPLLHVSLGFDPRTGKQREAKGIIAIGGKATGVIAMGGMAKGVIAVGGLALGVVAIGGVGLGVFSLGGVVLALAIAWGGIAVGPIAFGGLAIGYYAAGGFALGAHAFGSNVRTDANAMKLYRGWFRPSVHIAVLMLLFVPMLAQLLIVAWARRQEPRKQPLAGAPGPAQRRLSRKALAGLVWALFFPLGLGAFLAGYLLLQTRVTIQQRGQTAISAANEETTNTVAVSSSEQPPPSPAVQEPQSSVLLRIVFVLCALLGLSAPFGTTIYGMLSVNEIRRSVGSIYGLPLALTDALLFPLLLLDVVIMAACGGVAALLLIVLGQIFQADIRVGPIEVGLIGATIGLLISIPVDLMIVRYAWRTVKKPSAPV
jgi:predicted Ser/Thr protein kinase